MYDALKVGGVVSVASNIRDGTNPAYTIEDFLIIYPQFSALVPPVILESFLELAHATVKKARYKAAWKVCMGLFVAHFASLWLQTAKNAGTPADEVIAAAESRGIVTSESVSGVSYSADFSAISSDLDGWAQWKLTQFGIQYASFAKLAGKGGMYVW